MCAKYAAKILLFFDIRKYLHKKLLFLAYLRKKQYLCSRKLQMTNYK